MTKSLLKNTRKFLMEFRNVTAYNCDFYFSIYIIMTVTSHTTCHYMMFSKSSISFFFIQNIKIMTYGHYYYDNIMVTTIVSSHYEFSWEIMSIPTKNNIKSSYACRNPS